MAHDPRSCDGQRHQDVEQVNNPNNQALAELVVPQLDVFSSNIVRPQILANNFELKLVMCKMLQSIRQFNGLPIEDPHKHPAEFCDNL